MARYRTLFLSAISMILLSLIFYFARYTDPVAALGRWQPAAFNLAEERTEFGTVGIGHDIYLIGGIKSSREAKDSIDRIDLDTGEATTVARLPIALHHPAAAAVDGIIYIMGGFSFSPGDPSTQLRESARVFTFDIAKETLLEAAPLPEANAAFALVEIDNYLYVIGGQDGKFRARRTVYRYDIGSQKWERRADLVRPRNHLVAVGISGRIYAIGGRSYANTPTEIVVKNYDSIEVYEPNADSWQLMNTKMPAGKSGHAGAVINNRFIFIFGGEEYARALGATFVFDATSEAWLEVGPLGIARHGFGGVALDDTIYAVGGSPKYGFGTTPSIEKLAVNTDDLERVFQR